MSSSEGVVKTKKLKRGRPKKKASEKSNPTDYNREYYAEHRDKLSEKRKEKYASDPQHREKIKESSRDWYDENKPESVGPRRGRGFNRPRVLNVDGEQLLCHCAGEVARRIGIGVQTLSDWERDGIVPPATARDDLKRRWYSEDYIEFLTMCVETIRPECSRLSVFKDKVWREWEWRQRSN